MWGYHGIITPPRLRNPAAELCSAEAGRGPVVVDGRKWKGPEVLSLGSNVNSEQGLRFSPSGLNVSLGRTRGSLLEVECELRVRLEALSFGLNVSSRQIPALLGVECKPTGTSNLLPT